MPLSKADYGDFSASDPLALILRLAQDYWMPGEAPADPLGANVSSVAKQDQPIRQLPPVRIDLGQLAARPTPKTDPLAMGQPQPPLPPGWTQEMGLAMALEPGAGAGLEPSGALPGRGERIPMPERGERMGVPERNPAFHDTPDPFGAPELAGNDGILTTANLLSGSNPQAVHPTAGGAELEFLNSLSPTDRLKLDKQLLNNRKFTPEQIQGNLAATGTDALSVLPIIGHGMSAEMMFEQGDQALASLGEGEYKDAGIAALLAALGGVGAVAGLPTGRLAGQVAREGRDTLGVFAGPKSKTADLEKLELARTLEGSGASRDDIWAQTGWFRGPERKWRYEIPDNESALTPEVAGALKRRSKSPAYEGPLEGALSHPALFEAYPDLAGGPGGYKLQRAGFFSSDDAGRYYGNRDRIEVSERNKYDARDTTLHEIQHGIQSRENFARGGSLDGTSEGQDLLSLEIGRRFLQGLDDPKNANRPETEVYREAMQGARRQLSDDFYLRNAGEVEARNVELRADMTPEERLATPPWMTQEVPHENQIVTGMRGHRPEMEPAFVPVDPDSGIADTARLLYSNAPASWSKKSPDARNKMVAKETGVMFGADGRVIREAPLTGSGLTSRRFTSGDTAPISDVLEYPALYSSVPGLADTPLKFTTQRTSKGQPVAVSAGEGFEMTAGTAPDFQRRQLEKLLQYKVDELTGGPAAFRDNLPSQVKAIQDAMDQARIAMQVGAIPQATGYAYIRQLEGELRNIEMAQSLARSAPEKSPVLKAAGFGDGNYPTPKEVRHALSKDLHQRNAGNNQAKAALTRSGERPDPYALAPGTRPIPGRNSGQTVAISPIADQLVIPQPGTDVMELAKMLANWRQFGAGQGR